MTDRDIKVCRLYKHKDGGYYFVTHVNARVKSSNGGWESGVIYQKVHEPEAITMYPEQAYVRTYKQFIEAFEPYVLL